MKILNLLNNHSGSSLVEVLVAIGLTGIMVPALAAALITSSYSRPTAEAQLGASALLKQISVATNSAANSDWNNIARDGTFHPEINGTSWSLVAGSSTSGNYTEQVTIADVMRDSTGNIVSSGGTIDPSTKQITSTVSWTSPRSSSLDQKMYLSRYQNQSSWKQTSNADFNTDTLTNLNVDPSGLVSLANGQTSGTLTSTSFDAGKQVSFNYLDFTDSVPSGSQIKIQIATNNDNITWNYVGPDGTSSSFFNSPTAIPLSALSGRYLRYQVSFNTSSSNYPTITNVSVSYSQ